MKSQFLKRIMAIGLAVALFAGDSLPTLAGQQINIVDEEETIWEMVSEEEATEEAIDETQQQGEAGEISEASEEVEESLDEAASEETEEELSEEISDEDKELEDEETEDEELEDEELTDIEDAKTPLAAGLEEAQMLVLESVEMDGVTIAVSGMSDVIPEDTQVKVTELDPVEVEEIVTTISDIENEAKENETVVINRYKAFDITLFTIDEEGNEEIVEPEEGTVTVTFTGDMIIPAENEEVSVYHVADNSTTDVEKMDEVAVTETEDGESAVEMVTDHFSTYVITITGIDDTERTVTYYQYLVDGDKQSLVYLPIEATIKNGSKLLIDVNVDGEGTLSNVEAGQPSNSTNVFNGTSTRDYFNVIKIEVDGQVVYEKGDADHPFSNAYEIKLSESEEDGVKADEHVVKFYYENKTSSQDVIDGVTFFDYYVDDYYYDTNKKTLKYSSQNAGINGLGNANDPYLAMGSGPSFRTGTDWYCETSNNGKSGKANINKWVGSGQYIFKNLVTGLTTVKNSYDTVVYGQANDKNSLNGNWKTITGADFFSSKTNDYKNIYDDDYVLGFLQTGNTFTLNYAKPSTASGTSDLPAVNYSYGKNLRDFAEGETKTVNKYFLPLSDVAKNPFSNGQQRTVYQGKDAKSMVGTDSKRLSALAAMGCTDPNYFFGMRYDFKFTLGNYIGALDYSFDGDDDLWVFVDGTRVLDIGGIHDKVTESVDIWSEYFGVDTSVENWWETDSNYLKLDKNHEYQITVLYLERGGFESNCGMKFTLPNIAPTESVIKTPVDLSLVKVDADDNTTPIAGAVFGLTKYSSYTDENTNTVDTEFGVNGVKTVASNANGVISFRGLTEGKYVLREISAPDGYWKTNDTWTFDVVDVNNTCQVTVTDKNGNVLINSNAIVNNKITNKKIVSKVVDPFKNAELKSWDERTYRINLGATIVPEKEDGSTDTYDKDYVVKNVEFKDVISQYFDVVACSEGGVISNVEGKDVVTWTKDVKIDSTENLWIDVKAKETFAGGNKVPTNDGNKFTVTVPGKDPVNVNTPYVNVNCIVDSEKKTQTIFLGEKLSEYLKDSDNKEFEEDFLVKDSKYTDYSFLTKTITWTKKDKSGKDVEITWENLKKEAPTDIKNDTVYTMKVVYSPKNSYKAADMRYLGQEKDDATTQNNYIVKVIDGSITVTKNIENLTYAEELSYDGQPIFTFVLKNEEGTVIQTKAITFEDYSKSSKSATFTHLAKGTYTVEELSAEGWKKVSSKDTDNIPIDMDHRTGACEYTNKAIRQKAFADKDITVNSVTASEDGTIVFARAKSSN